MEAPTNQPGQESNTRLAAAIAQLAEKQSEENWRQLYQELLESNLWLVVTKPVGDISEGEVPRETGLKTGLVALRDDAGQVIVPAFTDVQNLRNWAPQGHPWMEVPAVVLLREIAKNPAAHLDINRGCEGQWRVTHAEIVRLAQGGMPQIALSPDALSDMLCDPATSLRPLSDTWPEELKVVLRNALVLQRPVVDAYLFELTTGASQYAVLGLRFTEMPVQALFTETAYILHAVAKEVLASDQLLQYMALNERDVLARVAESVEPFFARR